MNSSTDRIRVGLIGKPFGLRGHVTVRVETDDEERFVVGSAFPGPAGSDLVIDDVMDAERGIVLRFEGYDTRPLAEELRGHVLTIAEDERRQLDEDEYWPDDLVGSTVVDQAGEIVGTVTAVVEGPAQERLAIRTESGLDVEIPFVSAIVTDVDLELRTVTVDVIPGLIEG